MYNNFAGTSKPQVKFSDIRFRSAPTVTSNEFEMAIARNSIPDGSNPLFPDSTIKILIRNQQNSDWLPNTNSVFTYTFDNTAVPAYIPVNLNKSNSSHIRIMAYNTLRNSLLNNAKLPAYERIIKTVQPDIVGFVESYNTSTSYIKSLFDNWLPLGNSNGWYVAKHNGEVTVSRWEISQTWGSLTRQFPVLINLPDRYGTDLLYTNAHLNCCGNNSARQNQADQYAAFILDAKSPGGNITLPKNTPIIYSGDLNLVGLSQQLTTLLTGDIQNTATYGSGGSLDWDNTDLKEENALQADVRMNYTWKSDGSSFPPGKLDFIIYSDYTLNSEKSFVLQTEAMNNNRLNTYSLQASDTGTASDHFPVIGDFSVKSTLSNPTNTLLTNSIYPNPTIENIHLSFKAYDNYIITIYTTTGTNVISTQTTNNSLTLNLESLASGLYLLKVQNSKGATQLTKFVKK